MADSYGKDYDYHYGPDYSTHTGDPRHDLELERQYYSSYKMPDDVKDFVSYLQKAIYEKNVEEIQNLYEVTYPAVTEKFFKNSSWPEARHFFGEDESIFCTLYKELFYRHIYARVQSGLTIEHRMGSYFNYCDFFNFILNAEGPVDVSLPNQWLWEIIDEFIYQFQSYSHYKSKLIEKGQKDSKEYDIVFGNQKIWNVHSVLNVLHSLVEKSNINDQLEAYNSGGNAESVAGPFGQHPLYRMLGYFSLVGLLRLHSLLGDYYQAIKVLENIELHKKSAYSRVPACHVTTFYYVGFAYMMMRRYSDAIRIFSDILLFTLRIKHLLIQPRSYQVEQINKQTEQMYHLLAICLALHPQRIDETIMGQLAEKFKDKPLKLQIGGLEEFRSSFLFACPKFLNPIHYNPLETDVKNMKESEHQLNVFMDEVNQQIQISNIRSYMKLYTSMPVSKLQNFLGTSEELIPSLLCFKHKMMNLVWTEGTSGLRGEFQSGSELDFYIDKDMIHIADTKVARRYGDFFIRQIHKLHELNTTVSSMKSVQARSYSESS